jgi:hypothetical protein
MNPAAARVQRGTLNLALDEAQETKASAKSAAVVEWSRRSN